MQPNGRPNAPEEEGEATVAIGDVARLARDERVDDVAQRGERLVDARRLCVRARWWSTLVSMHEAYALYTTMYTTAPFTHLLEPLARRLGGALPLRPGQVHQVEGGATRARDAPGRVRLAGLEHDGEDGVGAGGLAVRVVVVVRG